MFPANKDIREAIKASGLKLWQVADAYGVNDGNFSRKLRKELTPSEKRKIYGIIQELQRIKRRAL